MKFRKKPVIIEAEQYRPGSGLEDGINLDGPYIKTLEGNLHISPGDWIITGIKGERYACKPDIFKATYERV